MVVDYAGTLAIAAVGARASLESSKRFGMPRGLYVWRRGITIIERLILFLRGSQT